MQNAVRDYSPTSKLYSALTRGFPTDEPQTRKTVHFWTQDQPPTSVEGESTDRRATRFRNAIDFLARLKAKPGTRRQEEDGSDDAGLPMEGKETPEESARALLALNRPLSDDRVPADRATPQNDATGDRAHPARRSRGRVSVRLPISGSSALASIVESDEPSGGTLSRAIPNTYQQTSERGTRIAIGFDIVPTTQSTASTGRASSSTEKKAGSNSVDGRSEASLKRTSITTWVKRSAMTLLGLGALGAGLYALYDPAGSRERAATFIRSTSEIAIAAGNYGRSSIAWGAGAAADGISSLLGD